MREQQPERPAAYLLRKITLFVTKTLRTLGVVEGADNLGFPVTGGGASTEETLRPYLDTLRDFRYDVRSAMREKNADNRAAVMAACDRVRDEALPPLGVRLEDISDPPSSRWKLDDPAVLVKEIEEKKRAQAAEAAQRLSKEIAKAEQKLASATAAAVPPADLLRQTKAAEFATFGDDGLPTQTLDGNPVSNSALKKLKKMVDKHQKEHDKLLKESGGDVAGYLDLLRGKLAALTAP